MKYNVEIFESNSRLETIDANSKEEALAIAKDLYERGELSLSDENSYIDISFRIV